jgi:hypothetical protein
LHFSGGGERRAWSVRGRLDAYLGLACLVWEAVRDLHRGGPAPEPGPGALGWAGAGVVRQLMARLRVAQDMAAAGRLSAAEAMNLWEAE